jgi:hypothetical protein
LIEHGFQQAGADFLFAIFQRSETPPEIETPMAALAVADIK